MNCIEFVVLNSKLYESSKNGCPELKTIELVYGFLESVPLFETTRVIVSPNQSALEGVEYNDKDQIIIGGLWK